MKLAHKFINGPINAVRLEGNIYGIHKILYVYMDYHAPVDNQTQCQSILNKDFTTYISEELYNIPDNTPIDFFLETGFTGINKKQSKYRDRYIDELGKFFNYAIDVDNTKNLGTKFGKLIRFHWIDVRDYFKTTINENINSIISSIEDARCTLNLKTYKLVDVKYKLNIINQELVFVKTLFNQDNNLTNSIITNKSLVHKKMAGIMNKINSSYHHLNTFESLNDIYLNIKDSIHNLITNVNSVISIIDEYISYTKKFERTDDNIYRLNYTKDKTLTYGRDKSYHINTIDELYNLIRLIDNSLITAFALIVDLYFLRRFIDKDYIKNGIVYTGISHSLKYIYVLVKKYNMNITHASYSKENLESVNEKIKNSSSHNSNINELLYPPYLIQCIDMTSFPEKFN